MLELHRDRISMKTWQRISQFASVALYNCYFYGFYLRSIYQGSFKLAPCPGLNCHSCPSAVFSCPVGALQMLTVYGAYHIPFYLLGFLGMIGTAAGRIICGWACPFGLLQDLLNKIPSPKLHIPQILSWLRYVILVVVVFGVALITGEPWFCKLCPAGTLEAGIPLTSLNADLRELTGALFSVKLGILAAFIILFVLCKRPFCRTVCPLGAIYGLFNKVSILRPQVDHEKCVHCDACLRDCPVEIKAYEKNACLSTDCIRCYRCIKCPTGAVSISKKFTRD